jgi:cytosine/adenosine deaminase-related metal-dependent hydrolase
MTNDNDLLVRDVRLGGSDRSVAIVIVGGRVESVGDAPSDWTGPSVDGVGMLALPGLVDGHAHLDKTMWGLPWRGHSADPERGLAGLIDNERSGRRELPSVFERAGALLDAYIERGTTLIRTHVDVDLANGVSAVEQVRQAADDRAGAIDVQVVAFPQSGMLVAPGTVELLDAAISAGADLVGGIDPAGFDGAPVEHLDAIFAIADRHGCGLDLHLHDRGALGRWEMGQVADRTRALGLAGKVTVSHAFGLCDGDPSIPSLVERLGEQRISLATVAPGNVDPLPLDLLDEYGVAVCLGQDGIRDLWSPWGDADMLVRAGLMGWRAGYRRDADLERCADIATTRGAAAIGVTDHALVPGGRGDVVLVDAACAAEAVVTSPPRRLVVAAGRVVAGDRALMADGRP